MCKGRLVFFEFKGVVSTKTLVTLSTATVLSVPIAALRTNPKIYTKKYVLGNISGRSYRQGTVRIVNEDVSKLTTIATTRAAYSEIFENLPYLLY